MRIALVGKARSGKDTVADYLKANHGFKEYKFSKGIHDVISLVKGPSDSKSKNRKELQDMGQLTRQALGEDVWVNYTFRQILQDCPENVVISDCRQENEAKRLKDEGYILVLVEAPEELRIKRMVQAGDKFTKDDLNHETENINFSVDYVITNDRTVFDVYSQVEDLLMELAIELEDDDWDDDTTIPDGHAVYSIDYVEDLERKLKDLGL